MLNSLILTVLESVFNDYLAVALIVLLIAYGILGSLIVICLRNDSLVNLIVGIRGAVGIGLIGPGLIEGDAADLGEGYLAVQEKLSLDSGYGALIGLAVIILYVEIIEADLVCGDGESPGCVRRFIVTVDGSEINGACAVLIVVERLPVGFKALSVYQRAACGILEIAEVACEADVAVVCDELCNVDLLFAKGRLKLLGRASFSRSR